jgi:hypothetical protein
MGTTDLTVHIKRCALYLLLGGDPHIDHSMDMIRFNHGVILSHPAFMSCWPATGWEVVPVVVEVEVAVPRSRPAGW